jgi:hypothetical protein
MGLTKGEKEIIFENQEGMSTILHLIEQSRLFKLDDVLIAYTQSHHPYEDKEKLVVNSYGVPRKYKVLFIDKNGIPYVKELNRFSKPNGELFPMVSNFDTEVFSKYRFEIDPEMADAIILDDLENFNPSDIHAQKATLKNQIVKHNKQAKLVLESIKDTFLFADKLKLGTTLWRSATSFWTLIDKKPKRDQYTLKSDLELTFLDNKGKTITISTHEMFYKNLYLTQPRSFNEIKDPK